MVLFCKTLSPFHLRMLYAKFGWNWPNGSAEEDFHISSMYFCSFVIISPSKKAGPFIWMTLNPLHPRMPCAKLLWNWPSGSWEEDFHIWLMYFHYYIIISPWKRGGGLHLNKFESPSPKDALCQVWLKLAQWFLRRRFLNFVNVFPLLHNYLPLGKVRALYLKKLESPSLRDALFQGWNWPSGSGEEESWRTDGPQAIRKAHLSFQLRLKAQVS